jgi:peptidyl-prolyl cis-trans isomerase C
MEARHWPFGVAVGLAGLAALASTVRAQDPPATDQRPAAVVNGETITMAELAAALKREQPDAAKMPEPKRKQQQLAMIGALVEDRLLQQFLRANGPAVGDTDVDKWIAQTEASLKAQGHTLKDLLEDRGWTEAQLRRNVAQMLRWTAYVDGQLKDADVKHYYDENRDFFDRVTVRAGHIVYRVPSFATPAEKQATRVKLQNIRADILAGKVSFEDAARKFSQCTSAAAGGDIGYIMRKGVVEEHFAKAAFALTPGEVSDVVESDYGLHLIRVTERKPGPPSDFAKVMDDVRMMAAEELRQAVLARQRQASQVQILLGEPVVKTSGHAP